MDYGAKLIPAMFELISKVETDTVCMMIFAEFIKIQGSNMDLIHSLLPKININKHNCPHYKRETLGVILALCQKNTWFRDYLLSMRDLIAFETRTRDDVAKKYSVDILSLLDQINPSTKPNNEECRVLEQELPSTN